MNDLDKKTLLNAIYSGVSINKIGGVPKDSTNWFKATENGDVYELVIDPEQIKQAFKNAGYSKSPLAGIKAQMGIQGMMTGREWYENYVTELKGKVFPYANKTGDDVTTTMMICEDAAKKAAGI